MSTVEVAPGPPAVAVDEALPTGAPGPVPARLGRVLVVVASGLCVQAVGDALARSGRTGIGIDLFFAGVALVFAAGAWRLIGTTATRSERLQVAVVLGLALVVSSVLASPLVFPTYDELLHQTTLWQLADLRQLFSFNSVLPVSPSYPGLELLTVAVRWLTGMPSVAAQVVVVGLARLVLVVTLFLFCERVTRSPRAGGLAVLVYALSPQFYAFNAAYSYQTLALAFGSAAVWFLLVAADTPRALDPRRRRRYGALSLAAFAGATVSHHLVGWLTLGLLLAWAAAASLEARRDPGARERARAVRTGAAGSFVISAAWTAFAAHTVFPYLMPTFVGAWQAVVRLVSRTGSHRALFHSATGTTPTWQEGLVVFSVLVSVGLVAGALWGALVRRALPGRFERLVPVAVSLGYVAVLASPLEGASSQLGQRGSTFVYLAVALLAAALLVRLRPRRLALGGAVLVATAAFLGSLVFGSGASWSYVPGPYLPAADQRSVDRPSIAAAGWAAAHLPVDARIAADRDNSVLMAAIGHLSPVTEAARETNVGFLYFDPNFGRYETGVIRQYRIRYLLVDQRLADGPPAYGVYFEPGAPGPGVRNRLTHAELDKFASVPGLRRIYDNGPIQIYDTAGLLATRSRAGIEPPIGRPGSAPELAVLVPAGAVAAAALALSAWRRRRARPGLGAGAAVAALVAAMVGAIGLMFAYVPSRLPTEPLAWAVLAGLLGWCAWSWRAERRRPPDPALAPPAGAPRRGRPRRRHEAGLVLLGLAGVAVAMLVAVSSDRTAFSPATALSVPPAPAASTQAEVSLASGQRRNDRLEVVTGAGVAWTHGLRDAPVQHVRLPAVARQPGARLVLLVGDRAVAEVAG